MSKQKYKYIKNMTEEVCMKYERLTTWQKRFKTFFLVLVWVCLGLFLEITGPTLIDLKIRLDADYEEVAVAVSGRSAGYFIGSAIGGVLVDSFSGGCELMIAISLTGGAAATICVPWFETVQLLWFMIVVQGTFEGIINIAGQKVIINLWREKAASPLHILHGGFGIGSFIVPLIANPFLAVPKPVPTDNASQRYLHGNESAQESSSASVMDSDLVLNISQTIETNATIGDAVEYLKESRIEYAYLISALITLALSVIFFYDHFKKKNETVKDKTVYREVATDTMTRGKQFLKKVVKMVNPASCAGGRLGYGLEIFCLMFLYFVNILGGERILGKFIRAFAIEQRGFSVDAGSYLNTIFWMSFAIGRISGFLVARWIPIRILILLETAGILVTSVLMNIFAANYDMALWILTAVLGFFHAPGFPSGIGWGSYHVEMTGMAITFVLLGGSIGGIIYLRVTGILFETYGPRGFLYLVLGYGIAAFTLALLMTFVGAQYGSRYKEKEPEEEEVEVNEVCGNDLEELKVYIKNVSEKDA